jgi:hypothetical protein
MSHRQIFREHQKKQQHQKGLYVYKHNFVSRYKSKVNSKIKHFLFVYCVLF